MFCGNCGTKLEDDARFCPECGTLVEAVPASAPAEEAPKAENKKEKKSKGKGGKTAVIAILLVILAGAIAGIAFYFSPGQQYNRAMKKGDALVEANTYPEAVEAYLNAYEIESSKEVRKALAKAYLGWGDACMKSSSFEEALSLFDEAAVYATDYTEVNDARVNCYAEMGKQAADADDYDKALEYFDQALVESGAANPVVYAGKARVLAKQGEVYAALDLIEEGISSCGSTTELTDERDYIVEHSVMIRKMTGNSSVEEFNDAGVCIRRAYYDWSGSYISSESLYNDEGKILKETGYNAEGNIFYEDTYEYDDKGNELTCHEMFEGETLQDHVYEYDDSGNRTKATITDGFGRTTGITIYEYDEGGKCTLEALYTYEYRDEEETEPYFTGCEALSYDEYGNVITSESWVTVIDSDGSEKTEIISSKTYEYEYDAQANILKCTGYTTSEGYEAIRVDEYQYSEDGIMLWNRKTEDHVDEGHDVYESSVSETTYNEKGLLLVNTYYYARTGSYGDYAYSSETHQTYDEHDNILTEKYVHAANGETTVETSEYEYAYDELGNMIWRNSITDGRSTEYSYEYKLVE